MTASPSPSAKLRLLAVHAHPDDESSKGAATMAMYAASGVEVMVATCTDGSRGDIQNPAMESAPHPKRDMAGARRLEMDNAAKVLGIRQRWLGFVDSGLPEGDPLPPLPVGSFATLPLGRAAAPLVRLVRSFKPHVILSYDENGGYPHPDHIMAHRVAVEAFEAAGDPARYPGTGEACPSWATTDVSSMTTPFWSAGRSIVAWNSTEPESFTSSIRPPKTAVTKLDVPGRVWPSWARGSSARSRLPPLVTRRTSPCSTTPTTSGSSKVNLTITSPLSAASTSVMW